MSGWHHGQILAPVGMRVLTATGGQAVPGSRYWVTGDLNAVLDTELALRDWEPV
ncbi:hypothetical protein AB0A60_20160 [Streptomyces sp. NPDC046275]|uniref:hypothetical protein n=1 Tax=Streptomyces sp. NPDC046275 TaxID=3157201 RepID=UPI0033C42EFD